MPDGKPTTAKDLEMQSKAFIVNEAGYVRRPNRRSAERACEKRGVRVDAMRAAHPSEDLSKFANVDEIPRKDDDEEKDA